VIREDFLNGLLNDLIQEEGSRTVGRHGLQNPNAENALDYYFELVDNSEVTAIHANLENSDPTVRALMECTWLLPPGSTIEEYAQCVEQRRTFHNGSG
jgi:hypothetical protein